MFTLLLTLLSFAGRNTCAAVSTIRLQVAGGDIHVQLPAETFPASQTDIRRWLDNGTQAVSKYLGKFPVSKVEISIEQEDDDHEIHGTTYMGHRIVMRLGERVNAHDLQEDWTLTHELFHLALPTVGEGHEWMEEGFATYLEPIARVRLGFITEDKFWSDMIWGLPKGLPEGGDLGLEKTHNWGRTYWGGTIFWFMSDIEIRKRTQNRKSLDDVVRAILSHGGNGSQEWPVSTVIEVGDKAAGVPVLREMYERFAMKPGTIDVNELWKSLGVGHVGQKVTYNRAAPLAGVRASITLRK